MCGIAGMLGNSWSASQFSNFFKKTFYRGPDYSGSISLGNSHIGMHRLHLRGDKSIIPIKIGNEFGLLNGQVFGKIECNRQISEINGGLEKELKSIHNKTADGMYASVLCASDGSEALLKTDPFFNKPLFYWVKGEKIAFNSELAPLLDLNSNGAVDTDALVELFRFGWYTGDNTWIKGIYSLVDHDLHIKNMKIHKSEKHNIPATKCAIGDLKALLRTSIQRCTQGSGPFGLALSGGLDSTILAFELNRLGVEDLTTFSYVFDNNTDGITSLKQLGLPEKGAWRNWNHIVIRQAHGNELISDWENAIDCFCQPTTMSSLPLTWRIAQKASSLGIRVMLCGEGVDEMFCGYGSYFGVEENKHILNYYRYHPRELLVKELFDAETYSNAWKRFYNKFHHMQDLRHIEFKMRLSRLLLRNDTCFMKHSIESRTPFLHNTIPQLALSIPWSQLAVAPGKSIIRYTWRRELGKRAYTQKSRFKMSDPKLRHVFSNKNFKRRIESNITTLFGDKRASKCLEAICSKKSFNADITTLLISLGLLVEKYNLK